MNAIGNAFSAACSAMNENLTDSGSRRRPPLSSGSHAPSSPAGFACGDEVRGLVGAMCGADGVAVGALLVGVEQEGAATVGAACGEQFEPTPLFDRCCGDAELCRDLLEGEHSGAVQPLMVAGDGAG